MVDLQAHYMAQSNANFWTRPRNVLLSREVNCYSLLRLNEKYCLDANNKAEAVRRILYDSGFSYDGVLPAGALQGDPQFASFYDSSNAITVYSTMTRYLMDVKSRGYDCTGRRQKSLYLQVLAGNRTAKKTLDAAYGASFPSHPRAAWFAIEQIVHSTYSAYLKEYGCPNRLCGYPMYPAISPPLPNPVKLHGYILRARKARDIGTLSWMLGREVMPCEMSAENKEQLIHSILTRFGYTSTEISVMKTVIREQEAKRKRNAAGDTDSKSEEPKPGGFLLGCSILFASIALCFVGLSLAGHLIRSGGTAGNIAGIVLLFGVLGFLVVLCRVFRRKKGRAP